MNAIFNATNASDHRHQQASNEVNRLGKAALTERCCSSSATSLMVALISLNSTLRALRTHTDQHSKPSISVNTMLSPEEQ